MTVIIGAIQLVGWALLLALLLPLTLPFLVLTAAVSTLRDLIPGGTT